MNQRNAPRTYGLWVGLIAGLFSILQVGLSVAAAQGSEAALRSMQEAIAVLRTGGIADPTVLIRPLIPMLAVTYLSMLALGLLTVWFADQAGRMTVIAQGRHAGGASAGMWVWLASTLIWLAASVVAVLVTNSDGTISGIFFGTFTREYLPQQLLFLLLQEVVAALICLGFCAMAGAHGARNAQIEASSAYPLGMAQPVGFTQQGAYPYAPYPLSTYPGYPAYPAYPAQQPHRGYPGYPMYPGYPAPGAPAPGMTPPPTQQAPMQPPVSQMHTTGPLPYPPPPSFYVPQRTPAAQGEPPITPAPQPAE